MKKYLKDNAGALSFFLLIMISNILFFTQRDKTGIYTKYSTYGQLYSDKNNTDQKRKKWNDTYQFTSSAEKDTAVKIAEREAGITPKDPVFEKIVKTGKWLINVLQQCPAGKPTDSLSALPMLQQLPALKERKSPVWCGTYGNLFLFFCKANNIETRLIEIMNPGNHHIVNECYVPELKQWVAVDLTNKFLYCINNKGDLLNTLDIVNAFQKKEKVYMAQVSANSVLSTAADSANMPWNSYLASYPPVYYYKNTNFDKVYTLPEKLKRYAFPVSFFEVYADKQGKNSWFYIRMFCLWITIPVLFYLFYRIFRKKHD
ncbi:MAG: transglutaminase domain-containing protein [Chitinophagaceae bacterium]|nr:transglutaminase domain-containing protein [Chitinophagaceae bacterium]MBK8952502.1 transglutaminase domain-containing protein [Chitinophagaceae bacterium]